MSSHESDASATHREAMRKIRDDFQFANPHYTPPEWADIHVWDRWLAANLNKHGIDGDYGFYGRKLDALIPAPFAGRMYLPVPAPKP